MTTSRWVAALVALLCLGGALIYATLQEPPVGRIEGRVMDAARRIPVKGATVVLTPLEAGGAAKPQVRYTRADEQGRFFFTQVPTGSNQISAYVDAFSVEEAEVTVQEGTTAVVTLELAAARPSLQLAGPNRHFTTAEALVLPVRGYVDKDAATRRAVHVRLYRTRLSHLLASPAAAKALSQLGVEWGVASRLPDVLLKPPSGDPARLVVERDEPITEAGAEGFYNKVIDFGRQAVGVYLVEAGYGGTTVATWLLVSDTALVIKSAPGEVLGFVTDARTGQPVTGSDVSLFRQGKVLAQGKTDGSGVVRLTVSKDLEEFFLVAVAQRGGDEAVVGRAEYRFEETGDFTIHAYTDRPIYRPGDRISYKAIVRKNGVRGYDYTVPAGQVVTIEVRDPGGEPIAREQRRANAYGSFSGQVDLSGEARTGTYAMVLTAGGTTATRDIAVAAYRKPEFAVTVTPDKPLYTRGDAVTFTVSAQYYFGAPVAGGTVSYSVFRSPDWAYEYLDRADLDPEDASVLFPGYRGDGQPAAEGQARLDDQGKAVITFRADVPDEADGPQTQIFTASLAVNDASGRSVTADQTVRVAAGDIRLSVDTDGYLAAPGTPVNVIVTARDHQRNAAPGTRVDLEMLYVQWNTGKPGYTMERIKTYPSVTGADGRAAVEVTFPRNGSAQLRARTTDARGRPIRASTYVWVAGDVATDLGARYAELSLATDKRQYRSGDVARVLINSEQTGQTVLLTVEGTRIHRVVPVPIAQRSTVVRLPIDREFGPNVFIEALYVKNKRLSVSSIGIRVATPESELRVSVKSDKSRYGPGDRVTYAVEIRDAAGKPQRAEFSFGVVDEAIYAIREDDPNALRDAFYPRRFNQVRTSFSFSLWYLGDADKAEPRISVRSRFRDTAFWEPALQTDAQGQATVSVVLPDNLTTWRATATAHTTNTRLGRVTQKVVAAKEFFVRLDTPRLLTEHDRSRVLLIAHNETDAPRQATVRLRVEGLVAEGADTQTVTLAPHTTGQVAWPVVARESGVAKIRVTAWTSGGDRQLTDGIELSVPVRPHGRLQVEGRAGDVAADLPATETLTFDAAANPGASTLVLRISPSVISSAVGALDYLIGYPYGCVEQTMSRLLPSVLVQRTLRTAGIPNPSLQAQIPAMVRDGLARLYRFQHESGGWGWWEFDEDEAWMTAYALYGLAVARAEGYPVSADVLEKAQKAALQLTGQADPDTRMFLLYAVALSGRVDGARTQLAGAGLAGLGPHGLAYRVLLAKMLGENSRPALTALFRQAVAKDGRIHWGAESSWNWDASMATSAALRAMLATNPQDPRIPQVVRWLIDNRTEHYWWSTRATSWALAALADYVTAERGAAALTGDVRLLLNGQVIQTYALTPAAAGAPDLVLRIPGSALRRGRNVVTLERTGGTSRVFYSVHLRQIVAMDEIPSLDAPDIRLTREYLRVRQKKTDKGEWTEETEPTGNQTQQGERIRVRLTITTSRELAYVLLEDPFPAGFEVTERGSADIEEWRYWWAGTDVRDDRVAFFVRSLPAGKHVIEYNLRA